MKIEMEMSDFAELAIAIHNGKKVDHELSEAIIEKYCSPIVCEYLNGYITRLNGDYVNNPHNPENDVEEYNVWNLGHQAGDKRMMEMWAFDEMEGC